jgi:iron complex outermembrane recepter protein
MGRALARFALLPLFAALAAHAQSPSQPMRPNAPPTTPPGSAPVSTTGQNNTTTDATGEAVHKLDRFEVTGSYIPVAGAATAIPVTTLDATAISDTGVATNLLDVLRKASPQFTGNGNLGNTNANIASGSTGGGSQLAFRNTQTLVLINGRRSAYAPILASGGFQFVDVNLLPISAVEKIEILQDGASAIYGTDAVGGVVNIILKNDFKGAELGAYYGMSDNDGNYAIRKFNVVAGAGNDRTNLTVSAEWTKSDPLFQYERQFSNPAYGTGTFAGVISTAAGAFYVLNPSLNAPPTTPTTLAAAVAAGTYIPVNASDLISGTGSAGQYSFNLAEYVTLLLGNERSSATVAVSHEFTDAIEFFGDVMFSQTRTYSQLNAQPTAAVLAVGAGGNPFNELIVARNRFVTEPRQYFYDTTNIRGTIGARGNISDNFGWEVAAMKNRIEQNYRNEGLIGSDARADAIASGALNYFARVQPAGALAASGVIGTALGQGVSELTTYDARINGTLWDLPAGSLGFALGVEWRNEQLTQTSDRFSQTPTFGWDSATTLDPFSADRDVEAAFLNVRIPIFGGADGGSLLEVEGAVRYEKYSDTDDPTVPKVQVRWLPFNDEFAVRATYSESFAAPTLFQLFGPGGVGFTSSLNLNAVGGGAITGQANLRSGSNPNLQPAESENWTAGVVWSPKNLKGFSLTVDYFKIEQEGLISSIGEETILQDVELLGAASPYAQFVRRGARGNTAAFTTGQPITAPGQISGGAIDEVYVTDTLVNIAGQRLAGVDFRADYTWNHDNWGRFDASVAGIWWDYYKATTLPGTAEFDTVGRATTFNGTIPEYQTYVSVGWNRGPIGGTLGWTYIPKVEDENWFDATDSTADAHVEAFHSVDVSLSYTFGSSAKWFDGMMLRVGALNVFNESPPSAKGTFTDANADIATYGAVGRFLFAEARFTF